MPPQTPPPVAPPPVATPSGAPVAPPPVYDSGAAMNNIRQFYQIPFASAAATGQQKANEYNAQTQEENAKANQQLQLSHLQDKLDPNKYRITNDPKTGGISILDPEGKPIDVGTYSNLTGADPAKVVANSKNPEDMKFVQAYNNYQDFMNNLLSYNASGKKDQKAGTALEDYYKANPGLRDTTPEKLRQLFMAQYGNYFGVSQANVPYGVSRTFSSANTSGNSASLQQALASLRPGG